MASAAVTSVPLQNGFAVRGQLRELIGLRVKVWIWTMQELWRMQGLLQQNLPLVVHWIPDDLFSNIRGRARFKVESS